MKISGVTNDTYQATGISIFMFMFVITLQGCVDGAVQYAIISAVHDAIKGSVVGSSGATRVDADRETRIRRHVGGGITTGRR